MKQKLCFLGLLLWCIAMALLGVLIGVLGSRVCTDHDCWWKARFLLATADTTVQPCENLLHRVCGRVYFKSPHFPANSMYDQLHTMRHAKLINYLMETQKSDDNRILRSARKMFNQCVGLSEEDAFDFFLEALTKLENLPLTEGKNWTPFIGWKMMFEEVMAFRWGFKIGSMMVINVRNHSDLGPTLVFSIPKTISEDYNEEAYKQLFLELIPIFRPEVEVSMVKDVIDKIVKLKQELHKAAKNAFINGNQWPVVVNRTTIGKLDIRAPNLYGIRNIVEARNVRIFEPGKQSKVIFDSGFAEYIKSCNEISTSFDHRVLVSYSVFETILTLPEILIPNQINNIVKKYTKKYQAKQHDRKVSCARLTNELFGSALSSLYIRSNRLTVHEHFIFNEIVNITAKQMIKMVNKVTWLDDTSKTLSIKKIKQIKFHPNLPERLHYALSNETAFDIFYRNLPVLGRNAIETYQFLSHAINYRTFQAIPHPHEWTIFHDHKYDIFTPYVHLDEESMTMTVSAGMMSMPDFASRLPRNVLYGGIGSLIARQMIRIVFDSITFSKLKAPFECYVNMHSDKSDSEVEDLVLEQAGLEVAFQSYNYFKTNKIYRESKLIHYEELSSEQSFFMSYASMFCCGSYQSDLEDSWFSGLETNSTAELKTAETLKNSKSFRDTFDCKRDSIQHPCKIW